MAHDYEVRASAPASLMMMGEHAVLFGHPALVCAVNQRMHVRLSPHAARVVQIDSSLGSYESTLDVLKDDSRFRFVLDAMRQLKERIPSGFTLDIRADFSDKVGLGSSAAVTVATVAALNYWLDARFEQQEIFTASRETVLRVQGRGSGADIAAATYGGVVAYRAEPLEITPLKGRPPIGLAYAGYKTPTPKVLEQLALAREKAPEFYDQLYRLMGNLSDRAVTAFANEEWSDLGWLMNTYNGLMDALGVNDRALADMVSLMREGEQVLGAKISGSGLGDCAIALGSLDGVDLPYTEVPVLISPRGVEVDYA